MTKPAINETLAFARGLDKAELAGGVSMLLFDVASDETDHAAGLSTVRLCERLGRQREST